ncbi:MAG: flagellar biosynthetic protein FliP [Paenibacillus sp. RIFOXYA1_FULL_44_5]|nr:MAG: flagellar biosynthetic protein FliP [Paenibacillus sp. RIFOXYA1_FULL_44_5]
MNKMKFIWSILMFILFLFHTGHVYAAASPSPNPVLPSVNIGFNNGDTGGSGVANTVSILLLITVLSIAPSILVLMTSFTRIVIVLGFARSSLGTQQMPPNQVLIGLALFLTFFIMSPVLTQINHDALQPLLQGKITQTVALDKASIPLKKFMAAQTREKDLLLFLNYTNSPKPKNIEDIPLTTLVPAFAISELRTAFTMGFMIFIPFLVIDMIVASTLMSMGMMMLPPVMISLPFKILLFVMVDGWYLVVQSLLLSYRN